MMLYAAFLRVAEMETGRIDLYRSGRPACLVTAWVEILRPAGQTG